MHVSEDNIPNKQLLQSLLQSEIRHAPRRESLIRSLAYNSFANCFGKSLPIVAFALVVQTTKT